VIRVCKVESWNFESVSKYFSILRGVEGVGVGWRGEEMYKASSLYLFP
jgi:hypothetical protein